MVLKFTPVSTAKQSWNQTLGKLENRVWEVDWGERVPCAWNASSFLIATWLHS